jgi:hypothetical protein
LGPARAGLIVRFWASTEVIHLSIRGTRIKSVASHLMTNLTTETRHLSQISWRGNVAHQVSLDSCLGCVPSLHGVSHGPAQQLDGRVSGRVRLARSNADRVFGTGDGCPGASD